MSALLTHALVGVLLGLALRWPAKWLPLAALLAAISDLDHLDTWFDQPVLRSRATLHNVFACIALPLAIWGLMRWRNARPEWQMLAAGAPVLVSSHLLLDLLPLDPAGDLGRAALFFPFSGKLYMLEVWEVDTLLPWAVTTMTALVVALLVSIGFGYALVWRAGSVRMARSAIAVVIVVWLLLFPVALAGGLLVERTTHGNARVLMEDPYLDLPRGRIVVTIYHAGGEGSGALQLTLVANETAVANTSIPRWLFSGDRWTTSFAAGQDPRNLTRMLLRLHAADGHTYGWAPVSVRRSHLDGPLNLTEVWSNETGTYATIQNDGEFRIPNGSLVLRLATAGAPPVNVTFGPALAPGANSTVRIATTPGDRVELRAVDDGTLYAQRNVERRSR